ncbi:hypothetical protein DFH11DRAFT_1644548 [Phellopilus nigrolimitatus]|nr:hypothetical protein DFH11DRAFT_1644548 [Phellopilus nigrolimitatus]
MSLDQNLFTLNITPRADTPLVTELIDPHNIVHYRKERANAPAAGALYEFDLFDPLSGSLLATVTAPSASSKHKTIELHNPSVPIELKYTGTFTFRWTFSWEEHEFDWKREECYLIRKPDPPVLVAITKEPPGRIKTKAVQILDYNLNRFDIHDRKGLEIVLLSALLSFQDYSDELHGSRREESATSSSQSAVKTVAKTSSPETPRPELPPKPPRSGAEKVAEMQKGELGEVLVDEEGEVNDYAQYCSNLLEGDNMLFVVLLSSSPATVSKVLQIAHQTKRIRHKAGSNGELFQYVQYDAVQPEAKKGPRIIKLDGDAGELNKYEPPESLTVHLSKIPMPELQPKAKGNEKTKGKEITDKERKRREKAAESERKEREKKEKKNKERGKGRAQSLDRTERRSEGNLLPKKSSPNISHISSHRLHPDQPSPSQLNNPIIYAAPKPRSPRPSLSPAPITNHYPAHTSSHRRAGSSSAPLPPHTNPYSHLGPYPAQRPVSAYGGFPGLLPPQTADHRPTSSNSLVNGLIDKLKAW